MASTLSKVRSAVRFNIRDLSPGNRAIPTTELNTIIQANTRFVGGQVPLGEAWVSAAVTVTSGSDIGTMVAESPAVEYSDILEVRRTVDGQVLTKRTVEELDKLFWQANNTGRAEPTDYAIMESAATVVTLRFNCYAATSTTLAVLRRVLPTDLLSDATTIPFASLAVEAVIDLSSVEAIAKLPEKVLADRNLNPQVASIWASRAEKNIRRETERIHRQRGVGRPLRFVP